MGPNDVSEKIPLTSSLIVLNHWKEEMKQDGIQYVPKENVDEYKKKLKTILGLEDDQFKECSQIVDQLVEGCEEDSAQKRKFSTTNEDKSLYGYFLCKKEKDGTFSFFCAIHSLEFELANQDGEPKIENLDIEDYQEKAVMVVVMPYFIRYGITGSKPEGNNIVGPKESPTGILVR